MVVGVQVGTLTLLISQGMLAAILGDIDKCQSPEYIETCDQVCVNTPGSFVCDYNRGYRLLTNGTTCEGKI